MLRGEVVTLETLDKANSRIEARRHWQSGKLEWFAGRHEWEGPQSVEAAQARRTAHGKETMHRRHHLNSLKVDAETFANAVCGDWP